MSETKHTPGPWKLKEQRRGDFGYYEVKATMGVSGKPHHFQVCEVVPHYMEIGASSHDARVEADARVIAAAPELLEAAREVRDILRKDDRMFLADRLEMAIEKAGGRDDS